MRVCPCCPHFDRVSTQTCSRAMRSMRARHYHLQVTAEITSVNLGLVAMNMNLSMYINLGLVTMNMNLSTYFGSSLWQRFVALPERIAEGVLQGGTLRGTLQKMRIFSIYLCHKPSCWNALRMLTDVTASRLSSGRVDCLFGLTAFLCLITEALTRPKRRS